MRIAVITSDSSNEPPHPSRLLKKRNKGSSFRLKTCSRPLLERLRPIGRAHRCPDGPHANPAGTGGSRHTAGCSRSSRLRRKRPRGSATSPTLPAMALVRCTCVVSLTADGAKVSLLDPGCDYVVHRLGAELGEMTPPQAFGA